MDANSILKAVSGVTKKWTKQRKAEERGRKSRASRAYIYSDRVNFTDVADIIIPPGYVHASGDGKYSVSQRQLYYAVRDSFLSETGRTLDAKYFTNTLLRQFLNRHPEQAAAWRITADPRGTLTIPNTGHDVRIPCGTLAISDHLRSAQQPVKALDIDAEVEIRWPSRKHRHRFQAVLYIEKEGFEPLLKDARIAERYDLAILSCKGQSVVAARRFVDEVCSVNGGVPLFVAHDLDKAGFEISQRLTQVSCWAEANDRVAYEFENEINVVDLGLRLKDAQKYELASESCEFSGYFASDSIATKEEQTFLRSHRRIELNAFTSPQFIEWLESKLKKHLPQRLIPADDVLEAAYRRAVAVAQVNAKLEEAIDEAKERAADIVLPKALRAKLQKAMRESDGAWDAVLYELAKDTIDE